MDTFIGTKILKAKPMTRGEYNAYRGWVIPVDENPTDPGYLVEYRDGGSPNHDNHDGYISWSPKDVFEESYRETVGMNFGIALEAMKVGLRVTREGWNGKGMFVFRVDGSTFQVNRPPLLGIYSEGTQINYRPHYDMCTANGDIVPWICSQSDMDAEDWRIAE